jgi:predicted RNA-binding Zn-ribbon protein involved in translation (DUF1610 family)
MQQRASEMSPCRKCGTILTRDAHIDMEILPTEMVRDYDDDGQSKLRAIHHVRAKHTPCPQCGEARPLNNPAATRARIIFLIAFFGIWAGGLYLLFFA